MTELDELSLVIEHDSCRTRFALAWNPGYYQNSQIKRSRTGLSSVVLLRNGEVRATITVSPPSGPCSQFCLEESLFRFPRNTHRKPAANLSNARNRQ